MPINILIADDDPVTREIVKSIVQSLSSDIKIVEAVDGVDAQMRLAREPFQILVSDLKMPKKDGMALIQSLASLDKHLQPRSILVLSGHLPSDVQAAPNSKIEFIPKGSSNDRLIAYFKKVLGLKETAILGAVALVQKIMPLYVNAIVLVLQRSFNIASVPSEQLLGPSPRTDDDYSVMMPIVGTKILGNISFHFKEVALRELSKVSQNSRDNGPDPFWGATSEVCNQVFDATKVLLVNEGYSIVSPFPILIKGKRHRLHYLPSSSRASVNFHLKESSFAFELTLAPSEG